MISSTYYPAIQRNCAAAGGSRGSSPLASTARLRRLLLGSAIAAAAALAITSCSGTPVSSPALKQVKLAAATSDGVSSLTASIAVRSVGSSAGGLTGTVRMQLKPTSLIEARLTVPAANSRSLHLDEILTGQAIYVKDPAFTGTRLGKPWVKANISELSSKSGITLGSLLQNLEGSNPLDQAKLFTASRDVRRLGARTVAGVATTEYAGSYAPKTAYAGLSARERTLLGPWLRSIGTHVVTFHVWIDAQHLIKKATYQETVRGQTVTTIFTVTSVNQPVAIVLPATKQTAPLPHA